MNTSRIGDRQSPDVRFPGGLATADVPTLLPRLVAYIPDHRKRNLPDQVSFRTAAGGGWSKDRYAARGLVTLVTDLAVLKFDARGATLASVHPWTTPQEVRSLTGFPLAADDSVPFSAEPDEEQQRALTTLDPDGLRTAEVKRRGSGLHNETRI